MLRKTEQRVTLVCLGFTVLLSTACPSSPSERATPPASTAPSNSAPSNSTLGAPPGASVAGPSSSSSGTNATASTPSSVSTATTPDAPELSRWRKATDAITSDAFIEALQLPHGVAQMIDPKRGVSVIRELDCERDVSIKRSRHLCDKAASAELWPLTVDIRRRLQKRPKDPPVACAGTPMRCTVLPGSECESLYEFVFVERDLRVVVERDDWQNEGSDALGEKRVRSALSQRLACEE